MHAIRFASVEQTHNPASFTQNRTNFVSRSLATSRQMSPFSRYPSIFSRVPAISYCTKNNYSRLDDPIVIARVKEVQWVDLKEGQNLFEKIKNYQEVEVRQTYRDVCVSYNSEGVREKWSLVREMAGKRSLIVAIPGAFTPTCTSKHLVDIVNNIVKIQKHVDQVFVLSTDNPDVQAAFKKSIGLPSLKFISDPHGTTFGPIIGNLLNPGGNRGLSVIYQRMVMYVE